MNVHVPSIGPWHPSAILAGTAASTVTHKLPRSVAMQQLRWGWFQLPRRAGRTVVTGPQAASRRESQLLQSRLSHASRSGLLLAAHAPASSAIGRGMAVTGTRTRLSYLGRQGEAALGDGPDSSRRGSSSCSRWWMLISVENETGKHRRFAGLGQVPRGQQNLILLVILQLAVR